MTTPQVKIVDLETGEETLRDMNAAELAQLAKDVAEREAIEAAEAKKQQKRKQQPKHYLQALGLTADDLKALGS
jgi:hypothetical protein